MDKEALDIMAFRTGWEDDRSFILATWLRGLYYGNPLFKEIEKDVFMENYHRIISDVLDRATTTVRVAVLKDDLNVILGYAVFSSETTLHWVFVKEAWRKIGIASKLIPQSTDTVTHLTILGRKIKPTAMKFNPFLL